MTFALRLWLGLLTVLEAARRGERGQSAVELIGVLALVALIVLAVTQSELLSGARRAVSEAVGNLFRAPQ